MSKILCRKRAFLGLIFIMSLAVCASFDSTVWAQAKPPTSSGAKPQTQQLTELPTGPLTVDRLVTLRYSCFGPARIYSISPQAIVFGGEHGQTGLTINIAGKPMTVMDEAGNKKTVALRSGTYVTVCSRADGVVVFINTEKRAGNAAH
jgi:hypothetical protein